MSRILLLGDHNFRDTPALAAIRVQIERIDPAHEVRIISFDLWQQAIDLFKPHIIVLNHLHGKRNQMASDLVRRRGGQCVVLPTEGRPNSVERIAWAANEWAHDLCDLYLGWSEEFCKNLPEKVWYSVVGGPRFDFYSLPLKSLIMSPSEVKERLGLNLSEPVVTVASSFPQAKFIESGRDFHTKDWRDLKMTTIPGHEDPILFAQKELDALHVMKNFLYYLRQKMPKIQIVLKPHPSEALRMWWEFCDENSIVMMLTDYIWNLLSVSDCHVVRADCLTTCEAWMMSVPVITVDAGNAGENGPGKEAMDMTTVPHNEVDFVSSIMVLLERGTIPRNAQEYIRKWLTIGESSAYRIAEAIVALLKDKSPQVSPPPIDDIIALEVALKEHNTLNSVPKSDHIGQFGKAITRSSSDLWVEKIRPLL